MARSPMAGAPGGAVAQQFEGQPGRDHEGHRQGNGHAHGRIDGNGAHVRPHQATDEGHGQQGRDHREGGQDGGAAHLVHGRGNQLQEGLFRMQAHVPVNVLHHHDGVVHQDADGEDQGEQGNPVQGEAPGPGGKQGGGQGEGHSYAHDQGLAPPQGEEHQQHHESGRKNQLTDQLLGFLRGGFPVIAGHRDLDAFGNHRATQLVHPLEHHIGHVAALTPGCLETCRVTAG